MQLSVAVDASGKILGFFEAPAHPPREREGHGAAGAPHTELRLDEDGQQFVHLVDVPAELERHAGKDSFPEELFKHSVVKQGSRVTLVAPARS